MNEHDSGEAQYGGTVLLEMFLILPFRCNGDDGKYCKHHNGHVLNFPIEARKRLNLGSHHLENKSVLKAAPWLWHGLSS